jgi:regulator of protease activity HflC (stomatin/prohibitin superfamily)
MDSALAWIGQIAAWLGAFIPRWNILDTTEAAIKFKRGKNPVFCGPGIHWYWPVLSTWHVYPTARQADRLQTQTIVTMDDKIIVVGGLIVYRVGDLLKLLTTTHNPATTVTDITLTSIHEICCRLSWEQLKDEQRKGTLDTKLKNAAQYDLVSYGVLVEKVMLIDLSPARVLKVMQSVSNEEN